MANKLQFYTQVAEDTAFRITENPEQWTAFLKTAARMYKYPYHDQLMIFAQRPDATACAEYDLWNQTMRRYVRRGARGIALLDVSGSRPRLRYVFDVSDTGTRPNSRPVQPWTMKEEYVEPVQTALVRTFAVSEADKTTLEAQLYAAAEKLTDDYWNQYSRQILDIVEGSILMDYDEAGAGAAFRNAVTNSTAYCLFARCTENPDRYFEPEDFLHVFDFDTRQAVSALGTAVSSLSERVFREIEAAIRGYERAKAAKRLRENREQSNNREDLFSGGNEHEDNRSDLHPDRGLLDSGSAAGQGRTAADRQIRKDAEGVSAGEPSDSVRRPDPDREAVSASGGNPADRGQEDRPDPVGAFEEDTGSGQEDRSDGLDAAHEQSESTGGRDRGRGTDHQLSITDLIPSEAEQIQTIDALTERAESEKPSAFFISDEEVDRVLRNGSGFVNGKMRIAILYDREADPKERADYLKNEYGTGGRSWMFSDDSPGSVDYDSKGLAIRRYEEDTRRLLRWPEVEQRIAALWRKGQYLTEQEQEQFDELRADYAGIGGVPLPEPRHAIPPAKEREASSELTDVDEPPMESSQILRSFRFRTRSLRISSGTLCPVFRGSTVRR